MPNVGDTVGVAEGVTDIPLGVFTSEAEILREWVCVGRSDCVTDATSFDADRVKLHANDTDAETENDWDLERVRDADLDGEGLWRVLDCVTTCDADSVGVGVGGGVIVDVLDGVTEGVALGECSDTVGSSVALSVS